MTKIGDDGSGRPADDPARPSHSLADTAQAAESPKTGSVGVTALTVLAFLYTIYFARVFLLPIAFALLLTFLLSPVIRALGKAHVPPPLGAAILVLSFVGVVGFAGYGLSGSVQAWITHAPETVRRAGVRIRVLVKPVDQVTQAAEQVEQATAGSTATKTPEVVVKGPTLASRFVGTTQALAEGTIEVVLLLYFLLAAGDLFLDKVVKGLPQFRDKRKAVTIARAIESSISTYLLTTAAINVTEGGIVAIAMWAIHMPTPLLWGAMVACLEFIPYIGMSLAVIVLAISGLTTFPSLSHALAAPAVFIGINFVQGNVVSPLVMSKRLTLNPVALFVGLAFWWWVWGIAGALLAVPLLAAFKICCDHVEALGAIGDMLGGREPTERRAWVRIRGVPRVAVGEAPPPDT